MATGSLADSGPQLEIEVIGAYGHATKLTCVVDTGFTGFLMIPMLQAFPIGLVLNSTMEVTFANGASENKLVCLGAAQLDGKTEMGLIVVEDASNDVLLGMDFLRKFKLKLIVCATSGQVEVVAHDSAFSVSAAGMAGHASPQPAGGKSGA